MSNYEIAAAYRNPETRANLGLEHPAGEVHEEELKKLAGAQDAQPQTTAPCTIGISITFCPTTQCTSSC